ncbi:MAG: hypothetical protein GQ474_07860 [Sulfurimonas sp.]|nr:hypothetical protein [Sulfurimonas sp.]
MTPQEINEWRVFPRLAIGVTIALWWAITDYMLFSIPMVDQSEWIFVQYGVICAPFVALINKYMDT